MRKTAFLSIIATLLACSQTLLAQDFYVRYDPTCMDKMEYRFVDNALDLKYFTYRLNKSATEKLFFETGLESPRIQKNAPANLMECRKLNFDIADVKDLNEGRKRLYIVKKLDSGWAISPVGSAAYMENANSLMTYSGANYELQADFQQTMGNNLALRYPNEESKASMWYIGELAACNDKAYTFKVSPSQTCRVDAVTTILPSVGLIREKSPACDLYELVAINNKPICEYMGGGVTPAPIAASEPRVESAPVERSEFDSSVGVTYDNPTSSDVPSSYGTVVRPQQQMQEEPTVDYNVTRTETFDDNPTQPQSAQVYASTDADCNVTANEGEHVIQNGESLYGIARRYGLTINDLRNWNGLRNDAIYPCNTLRIVPTDAVASTETSGENAVEVAPTSEVPANYEMVVTPKKPKSAPQPIAKSNCNVEATEGEHVVMQGENLSAISRNYGVKIADLMAWNQLSNDMIQPCQKLSVVAPVNYSETAVATKSPTAVPTEYKAVVRPKQQNMMKPVTIAAKALPKPVPVRNTTPPKQTVTAKSPYVKKGSGLHVVQKGESVSALAKKYNLSEGDFRKINYLTNTEMIFIGQVLRTENCACSVELDANNALALKQIPVSSDISGVPGSYNTAVKPKKAVDTEGVVSKSVERTTRKYHVVQSGETLYSIARLYKIDIANLRQINKLDENEVIIPDQLLVLE